jgi:lipopolysaccharide transport system ATP-binding protein
MSETAIRVERLGKKYFLRHRQPERYTALRDVLMRKMKASFKWLCRSSNGSTPRTSEDLWALKDVSFTVKQGDVMGIIGRNGAGKSTLLKILSRVTEPTTGRVEIKGRVSSLLEVGTGFHAELTGRENIFLNGAILGMTHAEIQKRFDEIVDFAEVEKFLDTPVKRYSSGMYLRLAFAVAAHLESEILIVDEVLAVGDAGFQKKCLAKMERVGKSGRTVLFVSHSMPTVTRLCSRAILLQKGVMICEGLAHDVVRCYLCSDVETRAVRRWDDVGRAPGNDVARLRSVRVLNEEGRVTETFDPRSPIALEIEFEVLRHDHVLIPTIQLVNDEGTCVFVAIDHDATWHRRPRPVGYFRTTAWIPENFLAEGDLIVTVAVTTHDPSNVHILERDAVSFRVRASADGETTGDDCVGPIPGVVRPLLHWTNDYLGKLQHPDMSGRAGEMQTFIQTAKHL